MARIKRPDGRYQTRVAIGGGKYKYVSASSQKELNKKIADIKACLDSGLDMFSARDTFGKWGAAWLSGKEHTVGHRTYLTYKAQYKRFEPLYSRLITNLRLVDFQEIFYSLAEGNKPLSRKTLIGLKQDAIQIMQLAIDNRVLDYN